MPRKAGSSAKISPEKLLELMRDPEQPKSISAILRETGLSSGTISIWKRSIPGFEKEYKKTLKGMPSKKKEVSLSVRKTGWEDEFLSIFSKTGRFYHACEVAGVHHKTVGSRIDKESNMFDPDFSSRYLEAAKLIDNRLEDVAHKKAIEDESDGMIKFLLQSRMPEKYGPKITNSKFIKAEIEFHVVEERAQKFLSEILDVIDAEFVDSTEEQALLSEVIREDEGSSPDGYNGRAEMVMQERSLLPASV